jgi:hypothetical protein
MINLNDRDQDLLYIAGSEFEVKGALDELDRFAPSSPSAPARGTVVAAQRAWTDANPLANLPLRKNK